MRLHAGVATVKPSQSHWDELDDEQSETAIVMSRVSQERALAKAMIIAEPHSSLHWTEQVRIKSIVVVELRAELARIQERITARNKAMDEAAP